MNLLGALAFIAGMAAFAFTHGRLLNRSLLAKIGAFTGLSLLSIPSLLFAVYYLHVLPEHAWLYNLRSWSGSEFLALFLGAAGGAAAAILPRALTVLPLLATAILSIGPYLKPLIAPLPNAAFHEHWEGEACFQSTASTCGPASTATILKSLGVQASEREIARAAFSYAGGTEAWYLARYARSRGLEASFEFGQGFTSAAQLPAVVGVQHGEMGHFIAVLEIKNDQVTYADPLQGMRHLPLSEFNESYVFTGFRMIITKPYVASH